MKNLERLFSRDVAYSVSIKNNGRQRYYGHYGGLNGDIIIHVIYDELRSGGTLGNIYIVDGFYEDNSFGTKGQDRVISIFDYNRLKEVEQAFRKDLKESGEQ